MENNELKPYLISLYKKDNILDKFSLALKESAKKWEVLTKIKEPMEYSKPLDQRLAEGLMEKFIDKEKEYFVKSLLEKIECIYKKNTEISIDYISELSQEINADTMIVSVLMAKDWKLKPPFPSLIRRNEEGVLLFDNKPILEIPSKYLKEMSNKIIIYNSGFLYWKTSGLSVNIIELEENNFKVVLQTFNKIEIKPKYIRIINLID